MPGGSSPISTPGSISSWRRFVLAPPATLRPAADAAAASARRARRPAKPVYLDPAAHETPAIALAGAAREALRMADTLEAMLRGALDALAHGDRKRVGATKGLDDVLDHLNRAIKAYLTELDPDSSSTMTTIAAGGNSDLHHQPRTFRRHCRKQSYGNRRQTAEAWPGVFGRGPGGNQVDARTADRATYRQRQRCS